MQMQKHQHIDGEVLGMQVFVSLCCKYGRDEDTCFMIKRIDLLCFGSWYFAMRLTVKINHLGLLVVYLIYFKVPYQATEKPDAFFCRY